MMLQWQGSELEQGPSAMPIATPTSSQDAIQGNPGTRLAIARRQLANGSSHVGDSIEQQGSSLCMGVWSPSPSRAAADFTSQDKPHHRLPRCGALASHYRERRLDNSLCAAANMPFGPFRKFLAGALAAAVAPAVTLPSFLRA
ncbi:hypothetical protein BCR34DRAFT_599809 [Clohesyomyces aquaticus]|uniref:Uncharacterized protein n=1 Tax=Clohesyomyces aquaticus TaxID=1231657 RepID=A0A1Y1ZTQ4_9PLEO|nr:hypothetical protein BCR34DRAFT_599809 [Clohesyomyces aquaticus]